MRRSNLKQRLTSMGACSDALDWVGNRTLAKAWAECPRGDWLLWLAERVGIDRRLLVLSACDCAEMVSHLWPDDGISLACMWALDAARRLARGETDEEEVLAAEDAVWAAAEAAAEAAARPAAWAARAAAWAAKAAAWADAGPAAGAAEDAVWAAGASSQKAVHRRCAEAVRRRITAKMVERGMR